MVEIRRPVIRTYSQKIIDFYNDQVRKKDSLWRKYGGKGAREYPQPWKQLSHQEKANVKVYYNNFKKVLPALKRVAQKGLIPVVEVGTLLGISETRSPITGNKSSGFRARLSNLMHGERSGRGKQFLDKVLKGRFKLQSIDVGEGQPTLFMKKPDAAGTKILQDYYSATGSKYGIGAKVVDRVKALHRNPTIIELLKKGNYADGKALAAMQNKWNWSPGEASTATLRLAQLYNGHKFANVDFALSKNKETANAIFKAIEKAPSFSPFHAAGYKVAMDTITENLGKDYFKTGTMASFKSAATKILKANGIPLQSKHTPVGFNLNEIIGVSPTVRTGAHPYSQFVNLMEGKFNQGHYSHYVRRLGNYQVDLQTELAKKGGDPSSVLKKFNKYNTDFRSLHGLEKGDLPTLSLKDPSKLYSPERLASLKAQGLDLPEHFKKSKYSIGVGKAATLREITESPELIKKINASPLKKIVELRVGCADGCLAAVAKNEPGKITRVLETLPAKARGFLGILGKFGAKAAPLAAVAALGVGAEPLVKRFRNDDYSTYLSDPEQQGSMLLAMVEQETPKVDQEILKWQMPALGAATAAGAIPGAGELYKQRRAIRPDKLIGPMPKGVGPTRAALGLSGVLGKALGASFSPLAVAATLPMSVAAQRSGGTDWTDIATDPSNWFGPAFAASGADFATKGMKSTGILTKAIRMGMSPGALRMGSRFLGLPGLALTGGMWGYDKWKNWGKDKDDEFKVRTYKDDDD